MHMPMIPASWQLSASIAAALLVVHIGCRFSDRPIARRLRAFTGEFVFVVGIFALYQRVGIFTHTRAVGGFANAHHVWSIERHLGLPSEVSVQKLVLPYPWLVKTLNAYYAGVHLTSMALFTVWMWWRHRDRYALARNTVALTTVVCVLMQIIPVAPPRMMPQYGFVDVAQLYGQSMYGTTGGSGIADQLAAMPSLHVAWAAILAGFAITVSTSKWRWLLGVHFLVTVFVVVATANHWWLDGIVGCTVLAVMVGLQLAAAAGVRAVRRAWGGKPASESLETGSEEHDSAVLH
jgi:PAP2 superfamily